MITDLFLPSSRAKPRDLTRVRLDQIPRLRCAALGMTLMVFCASPAFAEKSADFYAGFVRIGPAGDTCNSGSKGGIRYNAADNIHEYCDGTGWRKFLVAEDYEVPDPGETVTDGLVGWWKLDSSSGTTATDEMAAHNGTLNGGPTWQPAGGRVGGALQFDGVDDYIDLGLNAFNAMTQGTIMAWVKWTPESGWVTVFGAAVPSWGYELSLYSGNRVGYYAACAGVTVNANSPVFGSPSDWHHLALAADGSGNRVYIDGVQQTMNYTTGNASRTDFMGSGCSTTKYNIGTTPDTISEAFAGLIDEVRVYNRALTTGEIQQIYNEAP